MTIGVFLHFIRGNLTPPGHTLSSVHRKCAKDIPIVDVRPSGLSGVGHPIAVDALMREWDRMTLVFNHRKMRQILAMFSAERLNRQPYPARGEGIHNNEYEKSMRNKSTPLL